MKPAEDSRSAPAITEEAVISLGQIEVLVDGPDQAIGGLSGSDFSLRIDGRATAILSVDAACQIDSLDRPAAQVSTASRRSPTSYLLYFDQHNLTLGGRQYSIDLAEEMIPGLLGDGGRVAVVSAGQDVREFTGFSTDETSLSRALKELRMDQSQWDDYPSLEEKRQQEVFEARRMGNAVACQRAAEFQREELRHTEASLDLLSAVLGRLINEDPPKVAIYFGDTIRVAAGRHYFAAVSGCQRSLFDALGSFQATVEDAAAFGVRIYAIQGAGLITQSIASMTTVNNMAVRDAQSGLKALALDTGGDAFLGGASPKKIVKRIAEDSDCVYLLSFDPGDLPRDVPLDVGVTVNRGKVTAHARSQVLIQSESARSTAMLLAAFSSPEAVKDRRPLVGAVIPLGSDKGGYRALVQAVVLQSGLPVSEAWDVGMSLVVGRSVRGEASGHVQLDRPGVPIVLESEMTFRPGEYEVKLVGQETHTGQIGAGRLTGEWPEIDEDVALSDIALLQPAAAAFLRGQESRTSGSLAVPPGQPLDADLPTAILALVCRAHGEHHPLTVERTLIGEDSVGFDPVELQFEEERCAQVRDLIPAGTMTPGAFTYRVRVVGSSAAKARRFVIRE